MEGFAWGEHEGQLVGRNMKGSAWSKHGGLCAVRIWRAERGRSMEGSVGGSAWTEQERRAGFNEGIEWMAVGVDKFDGPSGDGPIVGSAVVV